MKSPTTTPSMNTRADSHNALLALGFGYCPGEDAEETAAPPGIVVVSSESTDVDPTAATRPMAQIPFSTDLDEH